MMLFTKPECTKCDDLKQRLDLADFGIREVRLTSDDAGALAELAFCECVELASKELPILVTDDRQVFSGVIPIRKFLRGRL